MKSETQEALSSIHYRGAKEADIPLPYVVVGFLVIAAVLYALRHSLGF